MKRETFDNERERTVLTAMIVSRSVLASVAAVWKEGGLFRSKFANIGGWLCVKYFRDHGDAPKSNMRGLFVNWATEKIRDQDITGPLEQLILSLSDDYEQSNKEINTDHIIKIAHAYFIEVGNEQLVTKLQGALAIKDHVRFDEFLQHHTKVEMGTQDGVFLDSKEVWLSAFDRDKSAVLIEYPDGLGEFFGDSLCRDSFVAFQAAEKRGKTSWLIDVAVRALEQRRKVAFFEAGDMSQSQIIRRFGSRFAEKPFGPSRYKVPVKIEVSKDTESGRDRCQVLEFEKFQTHEYLDGEEAYDGYLQTLKTKAKSRGGLLWLSCHDNSTLSVQRMDTLLEQKQRREEWSPDVVIVDYADILAPPPGRMEPRDQYNVNWKHLRRLSSKWNCLVMAATQANSASYKIETQSMSNFSEDKRKNAHVTGMVGINVTSAEKEMGVCRLNWLVRREADFSPNRCCFVAGCLDIGNPAIKSIYPSIKTKKRAETVTAGNSC